MTTSNHPLSGLLGDAEVARCFSWDADLAAMLRFEVALAQAQAVCGLIPAEAAARIAAVAPTLTIDAAALAAGTRRDGVVVPDFVKTLRTAVGAPSDAFLHKGATSQDAIDTSLVLRLREACAILQTRLDGVIATLLALSLQQGAAALTGHTRMQRALPLTAADKIETWVAPLIRARDRLNDLGGRLFVIQFGGAVGTRGDLDGQGDRVAAELARFLDLGVAPQWHSQRDGIVEFGDWLSRLTGSLGKMGADVGLMAQNEVAEIRLAGGGGSSAMPHKQNPVAAEVLVALARFNAGLVGTLHQALVHENERSGAAWTLEWLVLPSMVVACGAALTHAADLLRGVRFGAAP